jgi:hypothetical protein
MQLDDLKAAWAAHGAALDRTLGINERLLREVMLRKVRFALFPYRLGLWLEIAFGALTAVLSGSVLASHPGDVRYVGLAGAVGAFAIVMTAMSIHLLVRLARLDYGGPVTAMQREVEITKLFAYRVFKWALLGGTVFWLPAAMVLFEGALGVPAIARANWLYVGANIVFGLLLLVVGHLLARKYLERADLRPWARRLVDHISGRRLASVTRSLAELSSFEREP